MGSTSAGKAGGSDIVSFHMKIWAAGNAAGQRVTTLFEGSDEGQWSCHPDDVDALREIMDNCVKKAGECLKLNCPLASDSIVGASWLETH